MRTNWQIGDRIQNRWEIHKILRGGMGIVYIVYDHEWHEAFAAKTFQDEVFARSPVVADRFTQEALSWVNLDVHQNVTMARFVKTIEGKPYLFLEFVSGGDLSGWVGRPRLTGDLPQVLRFAIQFCDGMTHAVTKGIKAHRDIKPQNCLITQDKTLKVTDFGLAKTLDDTGEVKAISNVKNLSISLTRTGVAAGTPTHMAPEQFDDARGVGIRADIYSFGVMLYQMIEGQLPFVGQSWEELERLHKTEKPPTGSHRLPEINALVQQCLAKSPGDRFSDFVAVRAAMACIYQDVTGKVAPQPIVARELVAAEWDNKGACLGDLGRHEEAIQCINRAIELNPTREQAWYNKGFALSELGRAREAIACYDQALELNPHDETTWTDKGRALGILGQREEALGCFDSAIALNPRYEVAWYNKGIILNGAGRPEEALECFARAIEVKPRFATAWHHKGLTLHELGRPAEALECFGRVIAINPRDENAWYSTGIVLAASGRPREALECFDHALQINPQLKQNWTSKGLALAGLGRLEEALVCFDHALQINSHLEQAWNNKGLALAGLGRPEGALMCFDRALEIKPKFDQGWYNKGVALVGLGRSEEALECFDRALEINPRDAQAWNNKGAMLLNSFQRYREALECFEEAHRLGHPHATQAIVLCRQELDVTVEEK